MAKKTIKNVDKRYSGLFSVKMSVIYLFPKESYFLCLNQSRTTLVNTLENRSCQKNLKTVCPFVNMHCHQGQDRNIKPSISLHPVKIRGRRVLFLLRSLDFMY